LSTLNPESHLSAAPTAVKPVRSRARLSGARYRDFLTRGLYLIDSTDRDALPQIARMMLRDVRGGPRSDPSAPLTWQNRCRALRNLTGARIDFRFIGERRACSIDSHARGRCIVKFRGGRRSCATPARKRA